VTRTEILTALAYRLNKTPPPDMDSATQARLLGFMNQSQRRLLTKPGIKHIRDVTIPLASVADQATYVIPNFSKLDRITDTTNQRALFEMSKQNYRLLNPVPISGTPEAFVWANAATEAAKSPSDASALFVKSTSASDTTQTVYVQGVITGNYPFSASVTLTGTTAVTVSSSLTAALRIDKFYLSAACVGTVTIHEDSGAGTELGRITIGKTNTPYFSITLYPTPSGVNDYLIDGTRAITDFDQETDIPLIPEDFHDVMILGPLADEYQHVKDERYAVARDEYTSRVNELIYWLSECAVGQPWNLSQSWQRPSQLGSWFPANT
jgi:hypothetical protein